MAMRDGRGGARPRLASSGGLPGPTHRTAPVSCSPPGNKGTSLRRSGCHVGPAGRSPLWPLSTVPLLQCVPWEPTFSYFCPWGLTVTAPSLALGGDVARLPGRTDLLPRAGPGLGPLLGHRESGNSLTCGSTAQSPEPEWAGRPGAVRGVPPRPPGRAVPQLTPGTFPVTCAQRASSPGTSLLPCSQGSCLTAPRQASC